MAIDADASFGDTAAYAWQLVAMTLVLYVGSVTTD